MSKYPFYVVDVFANDVLKGNSVMIIVTDEDIDDQHKRSFSSWNGMPETVFLTREAHGTEAHYRARIFSPRAELGFAGHPSLGAAHVALELGWAGDADGSEIEAPFGMTGRLFTFVQRCNVGLVEAKVAVSDGGDSRAFVKTPTPGKVRELPAEVSRQANIALHCPVDAKAYQVSAGANWIVMKLEDQMTLEVLRPEMAAIEGLSLQSGTSGITAYAPVSDGDSVRFEVRSFGPAIGVPEDAICGGGNLCVAALESEIESANEASYSFETRQGRFIGRDGRAQLVGPVGDAQFWVGGTTRTVSRGTVDL